MTPSSNGIWGHLVERDRPAGHDGVETSVALAAFWCELIAKLMSRSTVGRPAKVRPFTSIER